MTPAYENILTLLANHIGVDSAELLRTEEVLVSDQLISMNLETVSDIEAPEGAVSEQDRVRSAHIAFFAMLGRADPAQVRRISRTLLEANNLWAGTSGCTLGLHRETEQMVLGARLSLSLLDGARLAAALSAFAQTARFWRSFVAGHPVDEIEPSRTMPFNFA